MTRPHRSAHVFLWLVLTLVVAVGAFVALSVRADEPTNAFPPAARALFDGDA